MPAKSEVQDYVRLLRHAIRAAGLTVTEVERRLGDGAKSLRRVFTGEVDLRFRHVISVLEVIGLSQEDFFAVAARGRRSRQQPSGGVEFLTALREKSPDEMVAAPADAHALSADALDRMVTDTLHRVKKHLGLREQPEEKGGQSGGRRESA